MGCGVAKTALICCTCRLLFEPTQSAYMRWHTLILLCLLIDLSLNLLILVSGQTWPPNNAMSLFLLEFSASLSFSFLSLSLSLSLSSQPAMCSCCALQSAGAHAHPGSLRIWLCENPGCICCAGARMDAPRNSSIHANTGAATLL